MNRKLDFNEALRRLLDAPESVETPFTGLFDLTGLDIEALVAEISAGRLKIGENGMITGRDFLEWLEMDTPNAAKARLFVEKWRDRLS